MCKGKKPYRSAAKARQELLKIKSIRKLKPHRKECGMYKEEGQWYLTSQRGHADAIYII